MSNSLRMQDFPQHYRRCLKAVDQHARDGSHLPAGQSAAAPQPAASWQLPRCCCPSAAALPHADPPVPCCCTHTSAGQSMIDGLSLRAVLCPSDIDAANQELASFLDRALSQGESSRCSVHVSDKFVVDRQVTHLTLGDILKCSAATGENSPLHGRPCTHEHCPSKQGTDAGKCLGVNKMGVNKLSTQCPT